MDGRVRPLSVADHIRCVEGEEAEYGIDSPFDEPVVLLNEVVQIFTLSQSNVVGEDSFLLQLLDRRAGTLDSYRR